jgi:uncharacterized protein YegP (UPF0339 family)
MTIHCYQDRSNKWRWRLIAGGRIIADSGQGYCRKDSLKRAVGRLQRRLKQAAQENWS